MFDDWSPVAACRSFDWNQHLRIQIPRMGPREFLKSGLDGVKEDRVLRSPGAAGVLPNLYPMSQREFWRMALFECTLCGKCCMHAGSELIVVEKRLTSRDYLCRQKIVGGTFRARVEERFLDIFRDTSENDAHPSWCPFLRSHPEKKGKYVCTIHGSRPPVCRTYICCTMRIFAGDGREVGKVKGRRSLVTEDAALRRCWDESVVPLKIDNDVVWRSDATAVLGRAGYRVEAYE